ncbi:phospholipase A1 VesT1.02-like [Bactrocera dorsalis]|uniref:Phospholipase A1 VesT1.02-like n=1 Tax=Bactrocera dorsalis TaxID=27457 RepID=A0ABM3JCL7_BACDO|nr:phospholipase A1 VesT1.02-like [Bactrocera dorsalis]
MKSLLALVLAVAAASAIPINEDRQSGEGGWYVPQLDGSLEWMTTEEAEAMRQAPSGRAAAVVYFHLYTNENPTTPDTIISGDAASLAASHFNKANPTKFIIHGWQSDSDSDLNPLIRDAYLASGKYNVFSVDWSDKAQTLNYAASVLRVPGVGKQVATFIDFLNQEGGLSFDQVHVIGHSLGAHVSGIAGKNVRYGRIQQITGLDPALPMFSYESPADRLNQNDAYYVESIQTCGGLLGFLKPIGKSAFYPNGGKSQPGCGLDLVGSCAHSRSWIYYAEAIQSNNFPSMKCGDYESAVGKSCGQTYSSVRMAAPTNYVNADGEFYVPVNKKAPYGMGL